MSSYRAMIDHSVQLTQEWVKELDGYTGWDDLERTYRLLRAGLQTVRDYLNVDEAAQFAAQLPTILRGVYYDGWDPSGTPVKDRDLEDFLIRIGRGFSQDAEFDGKAAAKALFALFDSRISKGETSDVRSALRKPLQELWPHAA